MLVVAAGFAATEVTGADPTVNGFGFVVLLGVAAAVGWIALGLLFNLWSLWLTEGSE